MKRQKMINLFYVDDIVYFNLWYFFRHTIQNTMMSETKSKVEVGSSTSSRVTSAPTYTTAPRSSSGISLCLPYFSTGPGIIKLIEVVSKIFTFIFSCQVALIE